MSNILLILSQLVVEESEYLDSYFLADRYRVRCDRLIDSESPCSNCRMIDETCKARCRPFPVEVIKVLTFRLGAFTRPQKKRGPPERYESIDMLLTDSAGGRARLVYGGPSARWYPHQIHLRLRYSERKRQRLLHLHLHLHVSKPA